MRARLVDLRPLLVAHGDLRAEARERVLGRELAHELAVDRLPRGAVKGSKARDTMSAQSSGKARHNQVRLRAHGAGSSQGIQRRLAAWA